MARAIRLACAIIALAGAAAAPALAAFEPAAWSQAPTRCDELAAHPDDPLKLAPGVSQRNVDLPAAIAACQAAVAADPANPRLNYQLARVLGYAGRGAEAGPYRERAVAGGYPQALFVVGYITLFGMNEQPRDPCRAADLIRRSALAGRFAGQVAFPHYALQGRFDGCPVPIDRTEMLDFLSSAARMTGGDYYRELLVERLTDSVRAWEPEGRSRRSAGDQDTSSRAPRD
jgi:hypothetical protein